MSPKKTAFLALVLLAALAYIYWVEFPMEKRKAEEDAPFAAVSREQFSEITIQAAGEKAFTLKNLAPKKGEVKEENSEATETPRESWELGGVPGAVHDPAALGALLAALEGLKIGEALPAAEVDADKSVYGLSTPSLVLTVASTEAASPLELRFGKRSEYLGLRYLEVVSTKSGDRTASSGIYLVPDTLFTAGNKKAFELRKRNLIEFADTKVRSATLHTDSPLTLVRRGEEAEESLLKKSPWTVGEGSPEQGAVVSESAVSELLRNLRNVRISEFYDGASAEERLPKFSGSGRKEIKIGFSDETPELLVSFIKLEEAGKKELLMKLSSFPSVFAVEESVLDKIFKTVSDLKEKEALRFAAGQIQEVELARKDRETLQLKLLSGGGEENQQWTVTEKGATSPGDAVFIQKLLSDLTELKIEGFPEEKGKDFGFTAPTARIVLRGASQKNPGELLVAALEVGARTPGKDSKSYYARVTEGKDNKEYLTFILKEEDVEKITPRKETLEVVPTPLPEPSAPPETADAPAAHP